MIETARIRWTDAEPYGGIRGTIIGYAGGLTAEAFRIYPPSSHTRKWTLSSYYPLALGKRRYADDPDELKAEAERWLTGFVTSLGAVFPEGECPECGFRPPTHAHDKNCSHYREAATAAGEEDR